MAGKISGMIKIGDEVLVPRETTVGFLTSVVGIQVWEFPHQTALCDNNTQQPNFSMEFRGGNDCSSVALIGLVIYTKNV
jgi:hypothetical protein